MNQKNNCQIFMETRRRSIEEAEKAFSDAKDEYRQACEKWQGWLRDNGFSTELDRNGIFDLIESVKKVKELIRKKEESAERTATC